MRQDGDGNGRNEQSRQQVEGLDLLDAQDAQAGGKDQHTAHQTDLRHQRIGDERSNKARQQVDGTLPAEQDDGRQRNADPECGREHNGRDTVQNRIGKQIGVIPLQRALDGAQDGQGARAVEQDGRGLEPLEILDTARSNRVSSERAVPMMPPSARLTINSTWYLESGMACTTELMPSAVAARPMESIMMFLYFSSNPLRRVLPMMLPTRIVLALAMVPIMVYSPFYQLYSVS